jgi:NAD(P) transhydrogenase subunit alpha
MIIGIPKESSRGENRVSVSLETVKKFKELGLSIFVEKGAGKASNISDSAFKNAGAEIKAKKDVFAANLVLKVKAPNEKEIALMQKGSKLVCLLNPFNNEEIIKKIKMAKIESYAMELMPRISRAQSMDVLSSQSNIAGYKAVLDGVNVYTKAVPLFMTAAGTVSPANFCIIGAGVAGLQAIATAKRLGGQVSAFDVRLAAKEQVESLGAKFIEVEGAEDLETKEGYAKEASAEYKKKQAESLANALKKTDIVVTTALIPGRQAPLIITKSMLKDMPEGSIVVDLAAESGGNVEGVFAGKTTVINGVKVIGCKDINSSLAETCSNLYAKNIWNFLSPHFDKETKELNINYEDETVAGTLVTKGGKVVNEKLVVKKTSAKKKTPAKKTKTTKKKKDSK